MTYGLKPDGSKQNAFQSEADGKYHFEGKLQLANRSEMKQLFSIDSILLRAGGDHDKDILSPLTRYLKKKCCDNESHITNKKDSKYLIEMGESLANISDWLREMAFGKRIRAYKVVNSVTLLEKEDEEGTLESAKRVVTY
jgi:hypothetical protein